MPIHQKNKKIKNRGAGNTLGLYYTKKKRKWLPLPLGYQVGNQKIVLQRHTYKPKPILQMKGSKECENGKVPFILFPPIHLFIQQKLTQHLLCKQYCAQIMNKAEVIPALWIAQL